MGGKVIIKNLFAAEFIFSDAGFRAMAPFMVLASMVSRGTNDYPLVIKYSSSRLYNFNASFGSL